MSVGGEAINPCQAKKYYHVSFSREDLVVVYCGKMRPEDCSLDLNKIFLFVYFFFVG